jgi:hypothetical protein
LFDRPNPTAGCSANRRKRRTPIIKIHHSNPSVDHQTVRKLKQVCESYWVMFKKLKEENSSHHHNASARKTNAKN